MSGATRLRWQLMKPNLYLALCGEEGQGRAQMVWRNLGWDWSLDMLPGDAEPIIVGARSYASAFQAMEAAQAQADAWPVLVEGARRV